MHHHHRHLRRQRIQPNPHRYAFDRQRRSPTAVDPLADMSDTELPTAYASSSHDPLSTRVRHNGLDMPGQWAD